MTTTLQILLSDISDIKKDMEKKHTHQTLDL